jgi:hypothetical protein
MPLSFGIFGKAVAILIAVAFALWLIFTYVFATEEEVSEETGQMGQIETPFYPGA